MALLPVANSVASPTHVHRAVRRKTAVQAYSRPPPDGAHSSCDARSGRAAGDPAWRDGTPANAARRRSTRRDTQRPATFRHGERRLLCGDPGGPYAWDTVAAVLPVSRCRKENPRTRDARDDFGLELAPLDGGRSRRIMVMRYSTREYQSDSSRRPRPIR